MHIEYKNAAIGSLFVVRHSELEGAMCNWRLRDRVPRTTERTGNSFVRIKTHLQAMVCAGVRPNGMRICTVGVQKPWFTRKLDLYPRLYPRYLLTVVAS
jgi:hypothetical protein